MLRSLRLSGTQTKRVFSVTELAVYIWVGGGYMERVRVLVLFTVLGFVQPEVHMEQATMYGGRRGVSTIPMSEGERAL